MRTGNTKINEKYEDNKKVGTGKEEKLFRKEVVE